MGQGMLTQELRKAGYGDVQVRSGGMNALIGHPADGRAQCVMRPRGIDLTMHRARQLGTELMRWADLVLVMEHDHKRQSHFLHPTARGKVYRLGEWRNIDVPDPYGRSITVVEETARIITKGVSDWVAKLEGVS